MKVHGFDAGLFNNNVLSMIGVRIGQRGSRREV